MLMLTASLAISSCNYYHTEYPEPGKEETDELSLRNVARILSELPLGSEQLREVADAVSSSSVNGYDEEYMMSDLFAEPGRGVGDSLRIAAGKSSRTARRYDRPLRELFSEYFNDRYVKGKSGLTAQQFSEALSRSDMQIYWPYSESWDGETMPLITFDPGYGAESNYAYRISTDDSGNRVIDSVLVDESVALSCPVWVINRNDDSEFTPLDLIRREQDSSCSAVSLSAGELPSARRTSNKQLMIKSFEMLRHYDSWFGGASEFMIKCGGADGFYATCEEEVNLYRPSITDFMVVVKRSQLKVPVPFEALILTDFTDQIDRLVFMITEDDGGTVTSWKCAATVKYNSKSFGFDVEIPYRDKDDIVWRGQLSTNFFKGNNVVTGRFGDVRITFETL